MVSNSLILADRDNIKEKLKGGLLLPLVESFYTIQGEGKNMGKPAFFIRLGGCDVGCSWCDSKESWNANLFPPVAVEDIIQEAIKYKAKSIVLTGGEPLNYPLDIFCNLLKKNNFEIFLETSGSHEFSGHFDWICLSPKKNKKPFSNLIYNLADELKVIIENEDDFLWAEANRDKVKRDCYLFLQPEWSRRDIILPKIIDYIKENPVWSLSLQAHKYINIP